MEWWRKIQRVPGYSPLIRSRTDEYRTMKHFLWRGSTVTHVSFNKWGESWASAKGWNSFFLSKREEYRVWRVPKLMTTEEWLYKEATEPAVRLLEAGVSPGMCEPLSSCQGSTFLPGRAIPLTACAVQTTGSSQSNPTPPTHPLPQGPKKHHSACPL